MVGVTNEGTDKIRGGGKVDVGRKGRKVMGV